MHTRKEFTKPSFLYQDYQSNNLHYEKTKIELNDSSQFSNITVRQCCDNAADNENATRTKMKSIMISKLAIKYKER